MKKLIVIHDHLNISPMYGLFKSLINNGIKLSLFSNDKKFASQAQELNIQTKKLRFCQNINSNLSALLYILFLPFYFVVSLFWLYQISKKQAKPGLLCLSRRAQVLLPLLSYTLKLKLIIFCSSQNENYSFLTNLLIKIFSRWGNYWVLTEKEKVLLKPLLSKKAKIFVLPLGIDLHVNAQDNLFNQLANAKREQLNKKFFSVGAIASDDNNYLKNLLSATRKCLNVIKEFQLIIICDIKIKNKMQWLAKKLEIDSLVWFVGKETLKRKWCDNLDVYVSVDYNISLLSFYYLLSAQSSQLPILVPLNSGLEDVIKNKQSGFLVDMQNSEDLSQLIINLYRDRLFRKKLGENGLNIIREKYTLDKMREKFLEIYN